jgi:hypothetical protein
MREPRVGAGVMAISHLGTPRLSPVLTAEPVAALAVTGAVPAAAGSAGNARPGKLATLVLSPATIAPGATHAYYAQWLRNNASVHALEYLVGAGSAEPGLMNSRAQEGDQHEAISHRVLATGPAGRTQPLA